MFKSHETESDLKVFVYLFVLVHKVKKSFQTSRTVYYHENIYLAFIRYLEPSHQANTHRHVEGTICLVSLCTILCVSKWSSLFCPKINLVVERKGTISQKPCSSEAVKETSVVPLVSNIEEIFQFLLFCWKC